MFCNKCRSDKVQIISDVEVKNRGCIAWLIWILLALCTFGLILIIPLITNSKTKSNQLAVCVDCGNKWKI